MPGLPWRTDLTGKTRAQVADLAVERLDEYRLRGGADVASDLENMIAYMIGEVQPSLIDDNVVYKTEIGGAVRYDLNSWSTFSPGEGPPLG